MYRNRSARSPSLDTRLAESDKIEGAGSFVALEWTKIDPVSRSAPLGVKQFLLEAEHVVVEVDIVKWPETQQGYGVVLVNTDDAGTLYLTNFRLLFLSEGSRDIIAMGTIPLAAIEKFQKIDWKLPSGPRQPEKSGSQQLLQIIGKDTRIIVFGFRPKTKQALVEKDWIAFGHPFSDRLGMATISGTFELSCQASTGSLPLSPMRQGSGSSSSQAQNTAHAQNQNSPIFLQREGKRASWYI